MLKLNEIIKGKERVTDLDFSCFARGKRDVKEGENVQETSRPWLNNKVS